MYENIIGPCVRARVLLDWAGTAVLLEILLDSQDNLRELRKKLGRRVILCAVRVLLRG